VRGLDATRAGALFATLWLASACHSNATHPQSAQELLLQERKWLSAYASHDSRGLDRLLAPEFVHVDYAGALRDRDVELRSVSAPHPFAEHLGEQTVTFEGAVAVVHGINRVTRNGRTIVRLRYTDVFVRRGNLWQALSAQETPVLH
jgi:hypothetical protein